MKNRFVLALCVFFIIFMQGCPTQFVQQPGDISKTVSVVSDATDWGAPQNLTASQGLKGQINLSWTKVNGAVKYYIYSSDSMYGEFKRSGMVSASSNEYSVKTSKAGLVKYYRVSAVKSGGTESAMSEKVQGTTLVWPYLDSVSDGENAASEKIVSWNVDESAMRNCYQNIRYIVHVGYTDGTESKSFADIMLSAIAADGSMAETSVTVTGLSSNTLYNYQVECYNILDQSNSEFSDIVYGTTSHSSTPDPVKDLQVAQGESTTAIRLEFKLPSKVDIKEKSEYISTGLYFKIYRRLAGSNYDYDLLDSRFGIEDFATDDMPSYTAYDEQNPDVAVVEWIDCPGDSGDENETKYTDTTLAPERGSKYEYKVVSYADTEKSITSTSSVVSGVTGWLISPVTFNVKKSYNLNEDSSAYDSVDVSFDFSFDSMGKDYKYRISYTKTDLDGSETSDENLLLTASTLDELIENSAYSIVPSDSTNGYYSYKFYILNCDDENIVYDSKNAAGSVTVIDSYSSMPVITNFSVEDGYLDKFVITFDYQDGVDYHLIYTDCITGEVHETEKLELTETNGVCKYEHSANSGDKRYYKLKAVSQETGISTDCDFVDESNKVVVCKTLGTPSLTMAEADYSSITVTWPVVQMADSYEVSARYSDGSTELIQTSDENSNGFTVLSTENDTVSCIINKPEGFDDSSSSGKTIVFNVSAKNNSTNDTSTSALDVYTLGPALIIESDAPILGLKDTLKFTWTPSNGAKANGAKKYIVYRISYGDKDCSSIVSADKLLIDATTCSVTELNEGQTTTGRTTCVYENGKYTLTDVCADAEEDSGYVVNQDKIRWGLPYGYVVFPVKENANKNTLLFSGDKTSFASNSLIPFDSLTGNIAPKICYTLGFGLNVHAAKSESASQITVTWKKPNDSSAAPVVYRRLYSPESGESNSWVKVAYGFNPTATKFEDDFSDSFFTGKDKNDYIHRAFEYAVEYVPNTNPSFNSLYLSEISTDDQNYDFGSRDKEPSNKGYLFAIKGLHAECGGSRSEPGDSTYFQENVQWNTEPWDFDERAICPETFELCIMNKNLSSTADWVSIAQFSINSSGVIELVDTTSDDDIDVNAVNYGAFITPESLTNGTAQETVGLLLVMRDTKHYYSLNITRKDYTDRQAGDESVYAYRQITDTELAKCVSLIIADALYECGLPKCDTGMLNQTLRETFFLYGEEGLFSVTHTGMYSLVHGTKDQCKWDFNNKNYRHQFLAGTPCDTENKFLSEIIITAGASDSKEGLQDSKLFYLPALTMNVSHLSNLSSFNKTVSFTAGSEGTSTNWSLTIAVDGTTIASVSNNEATFKTWFPYNMGSPYPSAITGYDSSLPLYNSPWWR